MAVTDKPARAPRGPKLRPSCAPWPVCLRFFWRRQRLRLCHVRRAVIFRRRPRNSRSRSTRSKRARAEAQAEVVAGEDGLVAAGTPCLMRHKRMGLGVDRDLRHRFAAATLATDPQAKEAILVALVSEAPAGVPAWRLAVARAELAVRDGRALDAMAHLRTAATTDVPEVCRADELFLQAAVTPGAAAAATLLDVAVAADPGFGRRMSGWPCLRPRARGMISALADATPPARSRSTIQLGALATHDTQFERLERALLGLEPNGRTQLLRGMILRQTERVDEARALWGAALATPGAGECHEMLRVALQRMMEYTPEVGE